MAKIANYSHEIEVDEKARKITVYRLMPDYRELYTAIDIPAIQWKKNPTEYAEFCRRLGEDLVIDSPALRNLLGH